MRSCQPVELRSSNVKHGDHTRPRRFYGCSTAKPFVKLIASNVTTSMLSFKVLPEFDGRELTCKAMNPWFLNGAIEDNRRISVSCKRYNNLAPVVLVSAELLLFCSKTLLCRCCHWCWVSLRNSSSSHLSSLFFLLIVTRYVCALYDERESMKSCGNRIRWSRRRVEEALFFPLFIAFFSLSPLSIL